MKEKVYQFFRIGICALVMGSLFTSLVFMGEWLIKLILMVIGD